MHALYVCHWKAGENRVAVEVADVRREDVRHPKALGEHAERVMLLVHHPAANDLLEQKDVGRFVRDHVDDLIERR